MNTIKTKLTNRGFTLIELLVVIAIIGILSSVVLTNLNSARAKARDTKRVSDIKQLQLSLELYADQNGGVYPPTLCASGGGCTAAIAPNYMSNIPTPPSGSGQTAYAYSAFGSASACTGYHLGAILEVENLSLLSSDADASSAGTLCSGSATNFSGLSNNCSSGGSDLCYDVTNQ